VKQPENKIYPGFLGLSLGPKKALNRVSGS
jgi:hypothetical protein